MKFSTFSGIAALLVLGSLVVTAAPRKGEMADELRNARASEARMPIYHENRLQFLVFGSELAMHGQSVLASEPIIDIVRKGVDVDDVTYQSDRRHIYPLYAPAETVFDYWKKHLHSEGIISANAAEINRLAMTASSEEPVLFRSPMLDLDGIGFVADYSKRTLLIQDNVKIQIRPAFSLESLAADQPPADKPVKVWADKMFIDFEAKLVTLTGNIRVDDERGRINCDQLKLTLSDDQAATPPADEAEALGAINGISSIECLGNVIITRHLNEEDAAFGDQQATAGRALYDVVNEVITLTEENPTIQRGSDRIGGQRIVLHQKDNRINVSGQCRLLARLPQQDGQTTAEPTLVTSEEMDLDAGANLATLTGNVTISDPNALITCHKMLFHLVDQPGNAPLPADDSPSGEFFGGGAKTVDRIECFDDVMITRKLPEAEQADGNQTARANYADYTVADGTITLSGGMPTLERGSDRLSGRTIRFNRNTNLVDLAGDCVLSMHLPREGVKADQPTVVHSDRMQFDYAGNLGTFSGNVRIVDPTVNVECNTMTIQLSDLPGEPPVAAPVEPTGAPALLPGMDTALVPGGGKEVTEIVCLGDVVVQRKDAANGTETEKASAGKAVYHYKESKIILSDGNPLIIRGRDSISGREVAILLDEERLIVDRDSKIILESLRNGVFQSAEPARTIVKSDYTDLNFGDNVLSFAGSVKITDPQLNLTADNLTIYLLDDVQPAAVEPAADPAALFTGGRKTVNKIVCDGNVKAHDPRADLNCDMLTLLFRENAAGSALTSQGGTELYQILCDGNIKLVARDESPEAGNAAFDELGLQFTGGSGGELHADHGSIQPADNRADFLGNVLVFDEAGNKLTSDELTILAAEVSAAAAPLDEDDENFDIWDNGGEPQQISIGAGKELKQIIARKNVHIGRTLNGVLQQATGEKAVYDVTSRQVNITGSEAKLPTLEYGKTVQTGREIIMDVDSGRMQILDTELRNVDPASLKEF